MASSDSGTPTAIAFRAPPFCSQDPLTKFNHAVTQLPSDVLPQVSAVISTAATADKPYEELKTEVIKSLQSSVATRLRELLSEELGDEKPSQLLLRMMQLLGDKYQFVKLQRRAFPCFVPLTITKQGGGTLTTPERQIQNTVPTGDQQFILATRATTPVLCNVG
ncbi:hypothetical protein E2C01_034167 [Portunus trituberculatus]|uniref:DUF7041 domain-containing protein n=1 Tax=Portunus trituberculatus TaxID=210409 RepID=A0A5B7F4R3_PORTR|nr:hypothetical protein [Portunus trituberculatus]